MFHYVYILVSERDPTRHYVGLTENLHDGLARHDSARSPHTSRHGPWRIDTVTAFASRAKARPSRAT